MDNPLLQEFGGELSGGKGLLEITNWVDDLPPFPRISAEALRLADSVDTTTDKLVELLSTDTTLAARVLRVANSSIFTRQHVSNLHQAVLVVGFRQVKSLIVAATLHELNKNSQALGQIVWEHSQGTAAAASLIAQRLGKSYADDMILFGLLHNLGQFVLLANRSKLLDYAAVFPHIKKTHVDYATAGKEVLGFSHHLAGALVAQKWNFPLETCRIILHYNDAIASLNSSFDEKRAILQLADLLAHASRLGSPEGYPSELDRIAGVSQALGLGGGKDVDLIVEKTKARVLNERRTQGR